MNIRQVRKVTSRLGSYRPDMTRKLALRLAYRVPLKRLLAADR